MIRLPTNYTPDRLYPIGHPAPNWSVYFPGRLPDGTQAIIGTLPHRGPSNTEQQTIPPLVGLFFTTEGRFLRQVTRPILQTIDPMWPYLQQLCFEKQHREEALKLWISELGINIETVHVLYFDMPEMDIGIADWPNNLFRERCEAVRRGDNLHELDEEDERHGEWVKNGNFVFYWGSDFWMNQDGTIAAS